MIKGVVALGLALLFTLTARSQEKQDTKWFKGMYFQWGYNAETYTHSNIHFRMSNGDNFVLHKVRAHDRGNYDDIYKKPLEISIPQYNYRIGFYLNRKHSRALELNFDHAKYVVTDQQTVRVTGTINGQKIDADSVLNPATFLHFEHTDGANWLHINYVQQQVLRMTHSGSRPLITTIWKAGAGINIPRTDFTWKGSRLNNNFHVAGYNISAEAGARIYPSRRFFFELTGKSGYINYLNALANSGSSKGNRASHTFGYIEVIGTLGWDINW